MKTHDQNFLYSPLIGNFLAMFVGVTIMATSTYVNGDYGWFQGHGPMIIGLFVSTVLVTYLHAYREAIRIEINKQTIPHTQRFWVRTGVAVGASILIHLLAEHSVYSLIRAAAGAVYIGGTFNLAFDYMLNFHRGKPLSYSSTAPGSAWFDRNIWSKLASVPKLAVKALIFLATMALYNLSFKHYL